MKKIFGLVLLLISFNLFGQNPPGYQHRTVRERINGSFMVDSTQHIPRYCGTPSGVRGGGSIQDGAIAMDTCNNKMYMYSGGVWRKIGSEEIRCGLTCEECGLVAWTGTGLNFYVTAADYNLEGASYHFSGDSITLATADATFGRFDAIGFSSSGLDTVNGVASSDPQIPQFDPCEFIVLTYVFVGAGATTPSLVVDDVVFDETGGSEWTPTTGGTITTSFTNTEQEFRGSSSAKTTVWGSGAAMIFTEGGSVNTNSFNTLSFWIRLTITLANNQNLSVQFFNGTTAVSNQVAANITKNNTSTWQGITLSPTQFTFTSQSFTAIKFFISGVGASPFYLDWVRLQSGITQAPPTTALYNAYTRITDGTNTATALGGDIFKVRANLPLRSVVTNNDGTHGDNILSSLDTNVNTVPSVVTNARLQKIADSLAAIGGGSGTVNSGTTGKPAYYVGATTLDDFAYVDYATTGNNVTITQNNTTDVGLLIKAASSSSEDPFRVETNGGGLLAKIDENGYGQFVKASIGTAPGTYPLHVVAVDPVMGYFDGSGAYTRVGINGVTNTGLGLYVGANLKWSVFAAEVYGGGNPEFGFFNDGAAAYAFTIDGSNNYFAVGGAVAPTRRLSVYDINSGTNTVTYLQRNTRETSSTATTGFGVGAEWELENASGTNKIAATEEIVYTDATNASEDADYVLSLIKAGTPTEGFRVLSTGKIKGATYGLGTHTGTPAYNIQVDASGNFVEKTITQSKAITIEVPSSSEAIDMWQTPVAITVSSLKAILRGSSPSVTYNIRFGTDITSATTVFTADITCTSVTTGCSNSSGFNDATIPAGSFIWVITSAQSGTVNSISLTINYTED